MLPTNSISPLDAEMDLILSTKVTAASSSAGFQHRHTTVAEYQAQNKFENPCFRQTVQGSPPSMRQGYMTVGRWAGGHMPQQTKESACGQGSVAGTVGQQLEDPSVGGGE